MPKMSLKSAIVGGFACVISMWYPLLSCSEEASANSAPARCDALTTTDFENIPQAPTQIMEAKLIPANRGLAGLCEVRGYVMPNIGFTLQLPLSNWNHKFIELGCGGACGSTDASACENVVYKAYACIVSDTGHRSGGLDGLWAYNNLQAQVDYGYRGAHVAALAGKAIAERYYGEALQHSYFWGCSTGGRQALVEAQRFPWDFDGIIAGGPWIDDTASTMDMVWVIRALVDKDGKSILNHAERQLVHDAALAQCDMDDGVKDGIIGNPLACKFDPADLVCASGKTSGCITAAQAEAVKKVYAGPTNSRGEKTFVRGPMPGSEMEWGMLVSTKAGSSGFQGSRSLMGDWATEYFRYMIMPALGSGWQLTDFDFDRTYKNVGMYSESLLSASNPDLRKFKSAGGKLIMYQGWNDPLGAIPEKTVDYYETVEKTMGGHATTQGFARLFMVPGMSHCGGGDGASVIDYLSYLETWVEHDKAPDRVVGAHISDTYLFALSSKWKLPADWDASPEMLRMFATGALRLPLDSAIPVTFTRPVYPYPIEAKYKGSGDPNKAEDFIPSEPLPKP